MAETPTTSLVIGGQDRPFAFGQAQEMALRALHHRRDANGQPVGAAAYQQAFGPAALRAALPEGDDLRDFVYSALIAGYSAHKARPDFTHVQVGGWLAEAPGVVQPLLAAALAALPPVKAPAAKPSPRKATRK